MRHVRCQKWMPRMICENAIWSALGISGRTLSFLFCRVGVRNMRKLVFITICATRGMAACRTWPKTPSRGDAYLLVH